MTGPTDLELDPCIACDGTEEEVGRLVSITVSGTEFLYCEECLERMTIGCCVARPEIAIEVLRDAIDRLARGVN